MPSASMTLARWRRGCRVGVEVGVGAGVEVGVGAEVGQGAGLAWECELDSLLP